MTITISHTILIQVAYPQKLWNLKWYCEVWLEVCNSKMAALIQPTVNELEKESRDQISFEFWILCLKRGLRVRLRHSWLRLLSERKPDSDVLIQLDACDWKLPWTRQEDHQKHVSYLRWRVVHRDPVGKLSHIEWQLLTFCWKRVYLFRAPTKLIIQFIREINLRKDAAEF